jgi:hypothetical protein
VKWITATLRTVSYSASHMGDYEPRPINQDVQVVPKAGRLAYLVESLAIVLLAALAAYTASA